MPLIWRRPKMRKPKVKFQVYQGRFPEVFDRATGFVGALILHNKEYNVNCKCDKDDITNMRIVISYKP